MTIDVTTITVAQFQAQFFRGFPYFDSIQYSSTKLYNAGNEVYDPATQLFWTCQLNGTTGIAPGVNANWAQAVDDPDNYVQDQDITNAFGEAQTVFNDGLYGDDATTTLAYLYLTAHFLANDLKAAMQGLMAPGAQPMTGRSVGSVSESYAIPAAYTDSPILAQYTSSSYGMKFLAMTLPALVGNVGAVCGGAQP